MEIKLFDTEEEVNAYLGIEPIGEPDLNWVRPKHRKAVVAIAKLFNIHEAHNQANGFEADWSDDDQGKYNPAHWIEKDETKESGFGFSGTDCGGWLTDTFVGSRLSVGTSKEAIHIAGKYDYLYQDLYFITDISK